MKRTKQRIRIKIKNRRRRESIKGKKQTNNRADFLKRFSKSKKKRKRGVKHTMRNVTIKLYE